VADKPSEQGENSRCPPPHFFSTSLYTIVYGSEAP
jgi:hypothetical protein